jgi:DNA helicase II / ATP-dependent DNA helicase PcrA
LEPLLAIDNWRTGLLDGNLPATRFFAQDVLPLVQAARRGDKFAVASIGKAKSPLLSPQVLKDTPDVGEQLLKAQAAVSAVTTLWDLGEPTIGDVLYAVAAGGFFAIPDVLKPVVTLRARDINHFALESEQADPISDEISALLGFLDAPFSQVERYWLYVSGQASFDTHQGVKGLEFDRVMVIMDDQEARGFMFGYDKLFGAKEPSATDLKNEADGKETGLDRTRRLLYVTSSRAEKSLALVAYTGSPDAVKAHVLANGWFSEDEIDVNA